MWHQPRPVTRAALARAIGRSEDWVARACAPGGPLAPLLDVAPEDAGIRLALGDPRVLPQLRRLLRTHAHCLVWWRTVVHLAGWPLCWLAPIPGTRAGWYLGGVPREALGMEPIEALAQFWLGQRVLVLPGDPARWGLPLHSVRAIPPVTILEPS